MTYSGSFNGFSFGNKARPGASVRALSGWRGRRLITPIVEGAYRNFASPARRLPSDIQLGLNLHGTTAAELHTLIDQAEGAFDATAAPLQLTIDGWSKWAQVAAADPFLDPSWAGEERTTTYEVSFKAADPVLYSSTQTTVEFTADTSASFQVANTGLKIPHARRAVEVRLEAVGTLVAPWVRIDHADGTYEKISFPGLTMPNGYVLTIDDLIPRLGSAVISGELRSLTERGVTVPAPRWWVLHSSTGADSKNAVTIGATSGAFDGYFKTRSTK